jgi:hypothetical protein
MSLFTHLLSTLPEGGGKDRIQHASDTCPDISDENYLRSIIAGMTRAEATSYFREDDFLGKYDASALAGLLVAPTGNYISISHLIIPSRSDVVPIYVSSHFSIALDNLKSCYNSHLISLLVCCFP